MRKKGFAPMMDAKPFLWSPISSDVVFCSSIYAYRPAGLFDEDVFSGQTRGTVCNISYKYLLTGESDGAPF
jgi:hypothetical protein